jgi:hypothetical protein
VSEMRQCPDHDDDCRGMTASEIQRCIHGATLRICGKLVTLDPLDGICPEMQRRKAAIEGANK